MQILAYPIGIVTGLLPITVDLGPTRAPADLLLDGRPVCALTVEQPLCSVDVGRDPHVHLLQLVRRDEAGEVKEQATLWLNRPGTNNQAQVYVKTTCSPDWSTCALVPSWVHPQHLAPTRVRVTLDNQVVYEGAAGRLPSPLAVRRRNPDSVSLLQAEAQFGDGSRAHFASPVGSHYAETSLASLQALPLEVESSGRGKELEGWLADAHVSEHRPEKGDAEVVFVVEPSAYRADPGFWADLRHEVASGVSLRGDLAHVDIDNPSAGARGGGYEGYSISGLARALPSVKQVTVIVAGERLSELDATEFGVRKKIGWVGGLVAASAVTSSELRTADAVTEGAYSLAGAPARRVLVLVVGEPKGEPGADASLVSVAGARAYLSEIMVPLVVLRVGAVAREEGWGGGRVVRSGNDFGEALHAVEGELGRQELVWIDGSLNPAAFAPELPPGVRLAGRGPGGTGVALALPSTPETVVAPSPESTGASVIRPKAPADSTPVFGASVGQVVVPASVADKNGHPVPHLGRDAFSVFEDKVPQDIATFEAIDRTAIREEAPSLPPRSFAVVFDDAGMGPTEASRAREAFQRLLDSRWRTGDYLSLWSAGLKKLAVFPMPGSGPAVADFVAQVRGLKLPDTEPRKTMTETEAYEISVLLDDRVLENVARRFVTTDEDHALQVSKQDLMILYPEVKARATEILASSRDHALSVAATLARAFRWLQAREGAKAVILISPGFSYDSIDDQYQDLARGALRAGAVTYLVDPAGLASRWAGPEARPLFNPFYEQSAFNHAQLSKQGADALALESGGVAFHGYNELKSTFAMIDDLSQVYYVLGYTPTNTKRDGKFRAIEVRVAGSGLSVRARRGYLAEADHSKN
jgi:VWFA-related protein